MNAKEFPLTVTEGGVTAKIRKISQVTNGKTYIRYVADFIELGKRKQVGRAKFEDARQVALDACRRVSSGDQSALELRNGDLHAYIRGVEFLSPTGIPIDIACRDVAESLAILDGKVSIIEACRDWKKRNHVVLVKISVADAVAKVQAQAVADGNSDARKHELKVILSRFAEAFECDVHTITPSMMAAYISVNAVGSAPLGYQWYFNSNAISGATATNYFIASAAATNVGNYSVVITNAAGSVTSSVAVLAIMTPSAYGGILAAWETTGVSGYGPTPFAATSNAPNVNVFGLARGSGVGTSGTAGSDAWGGTGFAFTDAATAITGNSFVTFGLTVDSGYVISFTNIAAYNIRHSSTGSKTGLWQYRVGNGVFTDIGSAITWGAINSSSGNVQSAIDLSGISALQNIPAGTNVAFRIVLWGGTGTGSWYINNMAATGYDLQVLGTLAPVVVAPTAPAITVPPVNTNVFVGKNAGFNVTATGTAPLNFQWLKNGAPLADAGAMSGSRTNTLSFTPAATNHIGGYSVIVTNLGGAVTSSVALLNVAPLPSLMFSNSLGGLVIGADGGAVSNAYIIQSATNLFPPIVWTPLLTNVIGTNGQIRFTETNYNLPASFYRIVIP